jgi:hypothetical protein
MKLTFTVHSNQREISSNYCRFIKSLIKEGLPPSDLVIMLKSIRAMVDAMTDGAHMACYDLDSFESYVEEIKEAEMDGKVLLAAGRGAYEEQETHKEG